MTFFPFLTVMERSLISLYLGIGGLTSLEVSHLSVTDMWMKLKRLLID